MIALLLAAASISAADAERAFARDAQRIGQWAAFRKWADREAVMFVPQATWARDFVKGRREPARALSWRLAESFTSCDGQLAVNTGPYSGPAGQGRFTTIWMKKRNGWRWIYDGGEPLAQPAGVTATPTVRPASCGGRPTGAPISPPAKTAPAGNHPADLGRGEAGDRTLGWDWKVGPKGARTLRVFQWDGVRYRQVVDQHIAPE